MKYFFYIIDKDRGGYLENNPIEGVCWTILPNGPFVFRTTTRVEAEKIAQSNKITDYSIIESYHHKEAYVGKK